MKRPFAFAGIIACAGSATAGIELDQYQPAWAPSLPLVLGGASEQRLAQSFQAGLSGRLDHVDLVLQCDETSPGMVSLAIHGQKPDGLPDSVVLGQLDIPAAELAAASIGPRSFEIPGVDVVAGEHYAIVMSATPGAGCSASSGPADGGFFGYSLGEAFYMALPNPPDWLRFSPGMDLPFWTYVDTGGGPSGPRYCDFKDASGIGNDWLPAHVPICGCLEDAASRANRCWFALPELTLWREFPLPLPDRGGRAGYQVLPLLSGLSGVLIDEVGVDGDLLVAPVTFDKGLKPGKASAQQVRISGKAGATLVNIRYVTPDGEVEAVFETRLGIPGSQ